VEAISTELDVTRLQNALNACSGTNQAVELTMDASGNNAFLTGPITLPTGVTLLIDPGVTLYFSRNAQDYDSHPGTHTCGTVSNNSNTSSCQNLITITNATNSGIMGYGEINARGGDVVLNSFATPGFEGTTAGKSWWDLATDANTLGASQQNPRGIQISKSSNITFYKFTYRNAPNFHVAISSVNGFTVWDMKIITPYTARNSDGIDPGGTVNATITQSWISDGDDNIALGASGAATQNVSVINNHFFAGHGESIGSITTNGVSNALFDNNTMYGDADVDGSNSTAIRIKSANDRGGLVTNIQYSNSCFANHGTQIQFTPVYNTNSGTNTPNFKNILLQNLRFSNQGPTATGLVQFLGASNNGVINPLGVTLDNVTMDALAGSNFTAPTNVNITLGPGQVSSTLTSLLLPVNGTNGNVITDNRTASSLFPPPCNFTFLIPELTSASGQNNVTVTAGQIPTAVVYLAPAFASVQYPYPTGTVTLTDEANRTFTATLGGKDTTFIPIPGEPAGTHTFTASYSGDSKYPANTSFGSLTVTVNTGSLTSSSLVLTGVPSSETFGTVFTATATVAGASPTGSVVFLVNGGAYATVPIASGTASYNFNLPFGSYTISAVYSGDANNSGSISGSFPLNVTGAVTTTTLASSSSTSVVGTTVPLTATVTSPAGTASGSVTFSYTTGTSSTPTTLGTGTLNGSGIASFGALLPQGTDTVTATYSGNGSFNGSISNSVTITVSAAPPVPVSAAPVPLPYTITTIVGGGSSNTTCTGSKDSFGDGCLGTQVQITGGTSGDLRGVTVDPFGNVYFTDANANLVRKVTPAGIVTQFAGYISGTACVPTGTVGCTATLVKLNKPRGVYSDPLGNIYIGGYGDNKVQVVRVSDGKMYLVAGTGTAEGALNANGDGGPATAALLKQPRSVGTDAAGNIYIADTGENVIREVLNPNSGLPGAGNIQTIAGNSTTASSGDGGLATAAAINNPQGVLIDANANVYIAESAKVRVVCVTCAPGTGLYSLLQNKLGVATPTNGDIYTFAGTGTSSNPTLVAGTSTSVNMAPQKLAMDSDGNLYIVDSANNVVWFMDTRTGYTHVIAGCGTTANCPTPGIGDGGPATQASFGSNGGNGIGVALDLQNNMYVSDSTNLRIRKVSNNLRFPASPTGTPVAQTVEFHFVAGDSPTGKVLSSPDFTLSTPNCTVSSNDNTDDCIYTATFTPKVAGPRSAPLSITTAQSNTGYYGFTGIGQGAGATLDPASKLSFGNNVMVNAVATDNAGNVYVADGASGSVKKYAAGAASAGTTAAFTSLGTFTNPSAVAVDSMGNVFVADGTVGSITQITPAGTTTKLLMGFTTPQGLAVDSLNNLYVTDSTAQTVTEIGSNQLGSRVIANANLLGPAGVAVDANLNVFVADPAASAVYRYDSQSLARTTATSASAVPRAVAVDAAGNLLVGDPSVSSILAVPASSHSAVFTVATGIPASVVALDSAGDIYTASAGSQVLELVRTQALTAFSGTGTSPITVNVLSTGNMPASLTLSDPDQTNFSLVLNPSTDCTGSTTASVVAGGTCQFTSSFTPASYGTLTNTATFSGNAANASLAVPAALEIVQSGSNPLAACVTTLSGKATASTGLQPARAALTWTPVSGVAGYNVLRGNVTGGPYTLLGSTTTPAYADTNGLANSTTYYYVVDPTNAAGQSLCQSNEATVAVPKGR
jgi:polygalacturonase/sugar lactone lactonase YvrE